MNDGKSFCNLKRPFLERSVTFNANNQTLSKYKLNQAKVKITFLQDSSTTVQNKRTDTLSTKPVKLVEKCVFCIENDYRREIKEAFNKFSSNLHSVTSKCTCSNRNAQAKSAKYLNINGRKVNNQNISHSNDAYTSQENRLDYYYKNLTSSLGKMTKNNSVDSGNKASVQEEHIPKIDCFNTVFTKSSTSITGSFSTLNFNNKNKTQKEIKHSIANLNKNIPIDINLNDLERIKAKYTNYLLNKQNLNQKQQSTLMTKRTGISNSQNKYEKSITSAINRVQTAPNKNINLTNKCANNMDNEFISGKETLSLDQLPNESSHLKIDTSCETLASTMKTVEENLKSESENDYHMMALSDLIENNSYLQLNKNEIIVDVIDEEPTIVNNDENKTIIINNRDENGKKYFY